MSPVKSATAPRTDVSSEEVPPRQAAALHAIEIRDVRMQVLRRRLWSPMKYSWTVTIKNLKADRKHWLLGLSFCDDHGCVVDSDQRHAVLAPGAEEILTGVSVSTGGGTATQLRVDARLQPVG